MSFSPGTPKRIIQAGLLAGLLDGLAASLYYVIRTGKDPSLVFKFIASAILGRKALAGGWEIVALGIALHFVIAMIFAIIFFWIYPRIKWLQRSVVLTALVYGAFVWAAMNFVVVPLSRINQQPFNLGNALIAMGILVACIGLPLALLARKHYLYKK